MRRQLPGTSILACERLVQKVPDRGTFVINSDLTGTYGGSNWDA
jgi:hypothetical protein